MTAMAAFSRSDSPASRARSTSPAGRHLPTDETIEQIIQQATANARAASGGRTPVIGRDTRTQLFVGNLPYRVRWQDLKDLFRKAGGTVLRADVSLGPDNRSRGYGTVLLSSAEDAGRAIDMFNGYVWQTRTLEVRPDRLPNDFDLVGGGTISKLPSGLSPQVMQYGSTISGGSAASALHSLSMSPSSAGSASLPPTSLNSSLSSSVGNSIIGHSSLGMTTGMASSQEQSAYTTDVRSTNFMGDITRSPSAFKMTPSNPTPKPFDGLGLSAGTGAVGNSQGGSAFSRRNGSSPPNDQNGRTVYVANWPSQYGPLEFDQFFRGAGNVLRSDLGMAGGMENRGYGTIVYSSEEEAKIAVARFNGCELNGWILRLQIGKVEQQQQATTQLIGDANTNPPRRRSQEYQQQQQAPNAPTEPSYSYPTYMTMAPGGYMVASQPGSPYDQYPPSVTYVPVTSSPGNGYPPPLNGGMYTYSTWHHPPPPGSPPHTARDMSNSASNGQSATSKPTNASSASSNAQNSTTTTSSSTTRAAPGRITLPNPNMGMYPPAPVSPMHGRPPITPSMPSFTFISQPMPTPPLHPQFLSPGLGPYSPVNSSPGFYRPMNPYFNLAPGAPVHYHHDPNAMSNNGVIGSGSNRPGMLASYVTGGIMGGGSTPYFDMTAATAGSDAPQEYFPPMPITASLAGAVHSMNLSSTSASNSAVGSSTGTSSADSSRLTTGQSGTEEDAPYLEPVGVGRDGFPSLSAKHSDKSGPADGMSRTGLTEWVTTPDDLPSVASGQIRKSSNQERSAKHEPALAVPPPPTERPISADPSPKKITTPTGSTLGTTGSTSPGSTGSGPIYSSSNKPKLTLGPIPRFHPPERMMNAYSAIANGINRTASGSGSGPGGAISSGSVQKAVGADQSKDSNSTGSGVTGDSRGGGTVAENSGFAAALGMGAGALKVNGTPNGFRDSLSADAGAGGTRRASWTEDASRRQAIINGLHGGHGLEGEHVR